MTSGTRQDVFHDLEAVLPLSLIRAHTKTSDIISVTDEQLSLYRASAFEAAERYTGLWLRGLKWITEPVDVGQKRYRPSVVVKLKHMPIDGIAYLYGGEVGTKTVHVNSGKRSVEIQVLQYAHAFNDCCNPCTTREPNRIMYQTGFKCAADIPNGIVVGMLKYIAFNIANAGDIGSTYLSERPVHSTRVASNDPVVASGAYAEWDRYRLGVA